MECRRKRFANTLEFGDILAGRMLALDGPSSSDDVAGMSGTFPWDLEPLRGPSADARGTLPSLSPPLGICCCCAGAAACPPRLLSGTMSPVCSGLVAVAQPQCEH